VTSPEGRRDRAQPVRLELRRPDAGTLLGSLAWTLGALQIMRDRGHLEGNEERSEFDEMYDQIAPRIERLIEQLGKAREASMTRPEFEEGVESAYSDVRQAFEAWIALTATDTFGAALLGRLDDDDVADLEGALDADN